MANIKVEVVTPEELLFSADAQMVVLPGTEGDFGVLKDHAPLISSLRVGGVTIEEGAGKKRSFFVSGGFVEVANERCTILAEEATDLEGVTLDKAKTQLTEAQDALTYAPDSEDKTALQRKVDLAEQLVKTLEKA